MPMLSEERLQAILELLEREGTVTVAELVNQFNVSEMTVRRDLDQLERQRVLRRVHGGAVSTRGRSYEPPYLRRDGVRREQKERIGRAAAELVQNGNSIAVDVGTTTLQLARFLADKQDLTVVTPSLRVASELVEHPNMRVIVTGGVLRPQELSLTGHLAEGALNNFYVDKLFLGIGGIDLEAGLTEYNLEDALVKRALLRGAKEIILLADSCKFGEIAFTSVAPLSVVNRIVTDEALDTAILERLREAHIDVIIA